MKRRARPRLAVIATHPIQYYAPLFQLLAARSNVDLRVFYGWQGAATKAAYDPEFRQAVTWDVPLLDGYEFTFIANESRAPGTHHFNGIKSRELLPAVRLWSPDAVLVYGWSFRSHLEALRQLHGDVPVLFRGDSTLLNEEQGPRTLARRVFLRWVYRHIDFALYVGSNNRRYFERHGVDDSQLIWVPHSVDNDRFKDDSGAHERSALALRSTLGIPSNAKVALFVGKFEPRKSPELLLQSVLDRGKSTDHLVFVGTGSMEEVLRRNAQGSPNVHFLGFQNQSVMPSVYRLADVVVLPSRIDTWGLAINEAMACGRPVIASNLVGCAPDLVRDGETGFVFPHGDARELSRALAKLLDDSDFARACGKQALARIDLWSLPAQAVRIEAAVERAVGSRE